MLENVNQLSETLKWLEDHSCLLKCDTLQYCRVFQTDLWAQHESYEAWFNVAVVQFCTSLREAIFRRQRSSLLKTYRARPPKPVQFENITCGGYLWPNKLKTRLLDPIVERGSTEPDIGNGIVLFGPPGTGKTTLAHGIAHALPGWQMIILSTADFLRNGQSDVYKTIQQIFADLRRLKQCVIFFDELELLVLERGGLKPDWTTGLITNVMLPELQELHDCSGLLPIFATNYISKFDNAGRRPGRFDFILPVGLPSSEERKRIMYKMLPPSHLFNGIENIGNNATLRELGDWMHHYRNCLTPGPETANTLAKELLSRPQVQSGILQQFANDIRDFSYPPDINR